MVYSNTRTLISHSWHCCLSGSHEPHPGMLHTHLILSPRGTEEWGPGRVFSCRVGTQKTNLTTEAHSVLLPLCPSSCSPSTVTFQSKLHDQAITTRTRKNLLPTYYFMKSNIIMDLWFYKIAMTWMWSGYPKDPLCLKIWCSGRCRWEVVGPLGSGASQKVLKSPQTWDSS